MTYVKHIMYCYRRKHFSPFLNPALLRLHVWKKNKSLIYEWEINCLNTAKYMYVRMRDIYSFSYWSAIYKYITIIIIIFMVLLSLLLLLQINVNPHYPVSVMHTMKWFVTKDLLVTSHLTESNEYFLHLSYLVF